MGIHLKVMSSLYRIQLFVFNMFGVDGQAPEMVNEAPKHMKWEPTHFTGLSLKLNLRLPCLFQVLSVRRIEKRRRGEKREERK